MNLFESLITKAKSMTEQIRIHCQAADRHLDSFDESVRQRSSRFFCHLERFNPSNWKEALYVASKIIMSVQNNPWKFYQAIYVYAELQQTMQVPYPPKGENLDVQCASGKEIVKELEVRFRQAIATYPATMLRRHGFQCENLSTTELIELLTGVKEPDILSMQKHSSIGQPAYCLMLHHPTQTIVLSIRGSTNLADVFTDFSLNEKENNHHHGMLIAAKRLLELIDTHVQQAKINYPKYRFIIVGHSLGAGVGALLTMIYLKRMEECKILENEAPQTTEEMNLTMKTSKIHCFSFSPPCTVRHTDWKQNQHITSVVYGRDMVARLSVQSIEQYRSILEKLSANHTDQTEWPEKPVAGLSRSFSCPAFSERNGVSSLNRMPSVEFFRASSTEVRLESNEESNEAESTFSAVSFFTEFPQKESVPYYRKIREQLESFRCVSTLDPDNEDGEYKGRLKVLLQRGLEDLQNLRSSNTALKHLRPAGTILSMLPIEELQSETTQTKTAQLISGSWVLRLCNAEDFSSLLLLKDSWTHHRSSLLARSLGITAPDNRINSA